MNTIYTLHGFLGLPSDWDLLTLPSNYHIRSFDLFRDYPLINCPKWAEQFNDQIAKSPASKRILMGYSMGGRLALHALVERSDLWDGAIIISTHPGLFSPKDRESRCLRDNQWASRFEHEPWQDLITSWNSQEAFLKDTFQFKRDERDYDRLHLAAALRNWSLGTQEYLIPKINSLSIPILWIIGSEDRLASHIDDIKLQNPLSKIWIAKGAGHRVPWQQSNDFQQIVSQFIKEATL